MSSMLPAGFRLQKMKDFERVFEGGKMFYGAAFSIKVYSTGQDTIRFGIIISNKVSKKATKRNLLRRRIREIIRHELPVLKRGFDVIILTNKDCMALNYQQLEEIMKKLFYKAFLYK